MDPGALARALSAGRPPASPPQAVGGGAAAARAKRVHPGAVRPRPVGDRPGPMRTRGLGYAPLDSDLLSERAWRLIARSLHLTGREVQVTRGVFDDQIEATIGSRLAISANTVHAHLRRMFRKLGVVTRVGLVLRVWNELARLILSQDGGLPPLCPRWAPGCCAYSSRHSEAPGARRIFVRHSRSNQSCPFLWKGRLIVLTGRMVPANLCRC
ncbi:MAG: helix-turn-helix transcriptional regulator [Limisphaerales bacterium]